MSPNRYMVTSPFANNSFFAEKQVYSFCKPKIILWSKVVSYRLTLHLFGSSKLSIMAEITDNCLCTYYAILAHGQTIHGMEFKVQWINIKIINRFKVLIGYVLKTFNLCHGLKIITTFNFNSRSVTASPDFTGSCTPKRSRRYMSFSRRQWWCTLEPAERLSVWGTTKELALVPHQWIKRAGYLCAGRTSKQRWTLLMKWPK